MKYLETLEAPCRGAEASRRRAVFVTAAVMGVLGLLVIAGLAVLALAPELVSGRAVASPPKPLAQPGELSYRLVPEEEEEETTPLRPEAPELLVMDVDAGADDAVALLLALRQEELAAKDGETAPRLVAVTCTHGNTELANVERNVLKTLHLAGRLDVPVYSGAAGSLINTPHGDGYYGNDGFGDFEYEDAPDPAKYLQKEHAVDALINLVKKHPGEITIMVTGPLSNIALAIRLYPNFLKEVKQVIVMGGSSDGSGNIKPSIEFNFYVDPEANYIVLNSTSDESKPIYIVPWDTVAVRNLVDMDWRLEVLGKVESVYMDFLNKAEKKALGADMDGGFWKSADPVTAALVLRPNLITASEQHHVDAEIHGEFARGALFVDYNDRLSPKNAVIVKSFNVDEYKEFLLRNLS